MYLVDRCRSAASNLLNQYCEANRPNAIWMVDVTNIPTQEGWVYLAAAMDQCTRKVERVHWQESATKQEAIEAVSWWIGT